MPNELAMTRWVEVSLNRPVPRVNFQKSSAEKHDLRPTTQEIELLLQAIPFTQIILVKSSNPDSSSPRDPYIQ
jgi:hypothetical protein